MSLDDLADELYFLRLDALRTEGFEGSIETVEEIKEWLMEERDVDQWLI